MGVGLRCKLLSLSNSCTVSCRTRATADLLYVQATTQHEAGPGQTTLYDILDKHEETSSPSKVA